MFTVHLHKNTEQAGNSYNNQQGQASHQWLYFMTFKLLNFMRWPWPHCFYINRITFYCKTPWRWPERAETCRSPGGYTINILKVHLLEVVIYKIQNICYLVTLFQTTENFYMFRHMLNHHQRASTSNKIL
jgi:hypothetical protein